MCTMYKIWICLAKPVREVVLRYGEQPATFTALKQLELTWCSKSKAPSIYHNYCKTQAIFICQKK